MVRKWSPVCLTPFWPSALLLIVAGLGCTTVLPRVLSPDWKDLLSDNFQGNWQAGRGEWTLARDVRPRPDNPTLLQYEFGSEVLVNGPTGKTVNLHTAFDHGDIELHIEFMVPRGSNSGVYLQSRYEVQVFDSWGVEQPKYSDCGGIYERWKDDQGYEGRAPRLNASRPPGEWQSFDIVFVAPRFDGSGKKIRNARFESVTHNGVLIHEAVEVTGPTRAASAEDERPLGPLMLQGDHGPVAYRNIRLRALSLQ